MNPLGIEKWPLEPAPENNAALEKAVVAVKVGGVMFPPFGPFATLFDVLTAHLRGPRLADWQEPLRVRLNDLNERVNGLTPEKLVESEAFVSVLAQATQAALKTHQKEKLEALRNAVLNVALGKELSFDRQTVFLSLIDRFTVFHLVALRFWNDPQEHFRKRGQEAPPMPSGQKLLAATLIAEAFPELESQTASMIDGRIASGSQFVEVVLSDLYAANLIALDRVGQAWAAPKFSSIGPSELCRATTHLGEDFLAFISEPA